MDAPLPIAVLSLALAAFLAVGAIVAWMTRIRSPTVRSADFRGFSRTPMITRSKTFAARSRMSRCPYVMGSTGPG